MVKLDWIIEREIARRSDPEHIYKVCFGLADRLEQKKPIRKDT